MEAIAQGENSAVDDGQHESSPALCEWMEITVHELKERYDRGHRPIVIDVREEEEWEMEHLPHTILIPLAEIPHRAHELDAEQEIIIICRSGNRSAQAQAHLLSRGFRQVRNVVGGIRAWVRMGWDTI
jgi:adenylyltransferase/sulfurtransferase